MNLEPRGGREPLAWPARTGPMDRRASWGASGLQAARETLGVGAPMDTQGKPATLGSKVTRAPREMLVAQGAEDPQETAGPKEARVTKATMDPQEVPV